MESARQFREIFAPAPRNAVARRPPCTFVLPCLNEAASLADVLRTAESVRTHFEDLEIIVVDNGSEDGSAERARHFDVRILHCHRRGYGAAVQTGIVNATHDLVVFADADNTYDWRDAVTLIDVLLGGPADLVVGNRLGAGLEPRAMPFLNRRLGTPVLSFFITLLFGRRAVVRDCNGGMRAFRKSAFLRWQTRGHGMEFASEMIVRALLHGAQYVEHPIAYRCAAPDRRSHLRRWRDGGRHLREIFRLFLFERT